MKANRLGALCLFIAILAAGLRAQTVLYPVEDREITRDHFDPYTRTLLGDGQWWPHTEYIESPPHENRFIVYFDLTGAPEIGQAQLHFFIWEVYALEQARLAIWFFEDDGTAGEDDFDPPGAVLAHTWAWENPDPSVLRHEINEHVWVDLTGLIRQRTQDRIGVVLALSGGWPDFDGNVLDPDDHRHFLSYASVENTIDDHTLSPCLELTEGTAATWPMKQRDAQHTGRADYAVPAERKNGSFFDFALWQTPSPGSPGEGNFSATSMSFYDGAGPAGSDLVTGTYHWPKGIQAMNRRTGQRLWSGLPDGGERIGNITGAFSPDGSTIYVTNDADGGQLFAFAAAVGPSVYRDSDGAASPWHLSQGSPTVGPDGRIFCFSWCDRPYGAEDTGSALVEVWAAGTELCTCYSEPSWGEFAAGAAIVTPGRHNDIRCFDAYSGVERWSVTVPAGTDATATIDPETGHIYVPLGMDSIYIAGLDEAGNALWGSPALLVYTYVSGINAPQRAQSAGCLSHDGATYYFQTVSQAGDGKLYAIHTADGSIKWTAETCSLGWEDPSSCPIVTRDGVVIVGNNGGGIYYAIEDGGPGSYTILDRFAAAEGGDARCSATLSPDGLLYLPVRTVWTAGNGDGQIPDNTVQNLYTAFDLRVDATMVLYPPPGQQATALNGAVRVKWKPIEDPAGVFDHYAVYRSEAPFESVEGMTPIGTAGDRLTGEYIDETAVNGTAYYYGVTAVTTFGSEEQGVVPVGPRTPYDETDLQMVSISRTPFYPRYCVNYTHHEITEPNGFGPYYCSAATGLGCGQDETTKHMPEPNEVMTYTATVRNRGTNAVTGTLTGTWTLDGQTHSQPSQTVDLSPGETAEFAIELAWDDELHELTFAFDLADARPENNHLTRNTLSVGFLTYIDETFAEDFREQWSPNWPLRKTDDVIDWLNLHMVRFNEMFGEAGCLKRVHYDVLAVLDDAAEDPQTPAVIHFASFPFRYAAGRDQDPRSPGYYWPEDDIDYGLLHEMGHQLGMIDLYQFDVPGDWNQVSGEGYFGPEGLMHSCSRFISEFHAHAMNQWLREAHGYYGQFLYHLPEQIQVRVLGHDGTPLEGAVVKVYQMCERPEMGKVITSQIKAQGVTGPGGLYRLPNVPIDPELVPETPAGDRLRDNPFGYLHVVGTNAVLLIRAEYNGGIDYAWLNAAEACNAYWNGQTETAVFDRQFSLGGPLMQIMPIDLAQHNADDWEAWAQGSSPAGTYVTDDTVRTHGTSASVHFVTDGGADTSLRYPRTYIAQWDLTDAAALSFWAYAQNSHGFQEGSPWIRLGDAEGNYFEYRYYLDGWIADWLNDARGQWLQAVIPLDADDTVENGWRRTVSGSPSLANIQSFELHADTWDYGFEYWIDDVTFNWPAWKYRDLATDGQVDAGDLAVMADGWLRADCTFVGCRGADLTQDHATNLADLADLARTWVAAP